MASASSPCKLCNGLRKKEDHDPRLAIDVTPDELENSAKSDGCDFCAILFAAAQEFGDTAWGGGWSMNEKISRVYVYGRSHSSDTLSMELYHKDGEHEPKRTLELFYPKPASPSTEPPRLPGVQGRPSLSSHPLSKAGLEWAAVALHSCLEGHVDCPRETPTTLPKRVLALEKAPTDGGDITVRLLSDSTTQDRYAALSHCWGSQQPCVTTRANLKRRARGIPWEQLPPTFQDAIEFCLAVGVYYIWIDALCIVQDDERDWQVESSHMADIYQNAHVTLAATSAASGSAGCFPEAGRRAKHFVEEKELRLPDSMTQWRGIRLREKVQHWTVPLSKSSAKAFPLLSRGWVFQERVLSPRVLHFCADEMVWECNSATRCECGGLLPYSSARELFGGVVATPKVDDEAQTDTILLALRGPILEADDTQTPGRKPQTLESGADRATRGLKNAFRTLRGQKPRPPPLRSALSASALLPSPRRRQRRNSQESHQTTLSDTITGRLTAYRETEWDTRCWPDQPFASQRWQKLVEQYSALLLSKDTDRLPALSGIASRVEPHLGGYRSGLWNSTLAPNLLWRVGQLETGSPAAALRGPSWSWTAVTCAVLYWNDLRVRMTQPEVSDWKRRRPIFLSCTVKPVGKNPFGEVAPGGEIVVKGSLLSAHLQYVWARQDFASTARVLDHFRYEVRFGGLELGMHADHVLTEPGSHHIRDGGKLWLLLVHPDVCLVLVGASGRDNKLPAYRRVGIVRQPAAFSQEYVSAVDWVAASVEETIRII